MNNPNPGILLRVLIDDASRLVRRAIIDDDPPFGKNRLMKHAVDGKSNICFFVANRAHDNIVCGQRHHIHHYIGN